MKRILQYVIGNMNQGGLENNLMDVYRKIDKEEFQFDFITHSDENYYKDEILRLGGKIYSIPFKSSNCIESLLEFRRILVKHNEYKIIHFHTSYSVILPEVYIAKKSGRKVFVHAHASAGEGKKKKIINCLLKNWLDELADKHIAVSKNAAKWQFSKATIESENFTIINNSIDTERFGFNRKLRKRIRASKGWQNKFIIGNSGRLVQGKNVQFLIELMSTLEVLNHNIKLIIVGDGPYREELETIVRDKKLTSVEFIGSTDKVGDYLNAFDIFCFPSLYEGLGISVIEAECTGLPCLINKSLPYELDIVKDVYRLPLNHRVWINKIQEVYASPPCERSNCAELIDRAGFGSLGNAHKLEALYREEM